MARTNHRRDRQLKAAYRQHAYSIQQACNLCGEPINYRLGWPDPGAWTLEHLTPLTVGGNKREWANLGSAHKLCQDRQGGRLSQGIEPAVNSRAW